MDTEKLLSYSIGFVFLLFGGLKLAGEKSIIGLIDQTIFFLPTEIFIALLSVWEVAIGACFIYQPLKKKGLYLLVPHMAGTFLTYLVAPRGCFLKFRPHH